MMLMSYRGRPAFDGDLPAATTERPFVIGEGRPTKS
jgi:hypothetical protein